MSEEGAIVVHYDEPIVRDAVRTFVWRRFIVEEKLLWAGALAMLIMFSWLVATGDWSWLAILTGAGALLPLLFVLVGWRTHLSASLGRLRAMPEPEARFVFEGQGLKVTSGLGEFSLPWSSVTCAWVRPKYWLLLIAPNQFITLPTQNLASETLDRLRGWLGAKVIDL